MRIVRITTVLWVWTLFQPGLARDLVIPHLPTDSSSWRSILQADNTGNSAGTMTVILYNQGEEVLNQNIAVEAMNETVIDIGTLAPQATCGHVTVSNPSINIRLSYETLSTGGVAEFSLADSGAQRLGFYFSDFASTLAWKGAGIANMGEETAEVTLTAWGGGVALDQKTVTIPPNSRTAGVHTDWFPDTAFTDIKKIIAETARGQLHGVAISGNHDSSQLLFGLGDPLTVLEDTFTVTTPQGPVAAILDGTVIAADYWSDEPKILSAGLGFCDIGGILADEVNQETTRQAGGTWLPDVDCGNFVFNTSTTTQDNLATVYIARDPYQELKDGAIGLDGLPIVFSWPVVTDTIDLTDIRLTMNNGDIVTPDAVSSWPNIENNERNCIVIFGEFGNKKPSNDPESRFPIKVEIVADDNPLMLVSPSGELVSAVGLSRENTSSPYDENNGPRLVGAKLNYVGDSAVGEGVSNPFSGAIVPPNDEFLLYPEHNGGDYRLRVLTSGGFSPNGVQGLLPTDYEKFFRLHVTGADGNTVLLEQANIDYEVMGGTLRVLGLSDLGQPEGDGVTYDACYGEDRDNYIDIILVGDDAAARNIQFVEIPSLDGGYSAFYNPGGPGTDPFPEEAYTAPGPQDLEPVIMALDDPMRVTLP